VSTAVTARAHCIGSCGWTAGPGAWAAVDRAAERHVRGGHATATVAAPKTTAGSLPAVDPAEE